MRSLRIDCRRLIGKIMRNIHQLKNYLIQHLKSALTRPGMYGGEFSIREYLAHLTFIDEKEKLLKKYYENL